VGRGCASNLPRGLPPLVLFSAFLPSAGEASWVCRGTQHKHKLGTQVNATLEDSSAYLDACKHVI
jgi:hypothetical protein